MKLPWKVQLPFGTTKACQLFALELIWSAFKFDWQSDYPQFVVYVPDNKESERAFGLLLAKHKASATCEATGEHVEGKDFHRFTQGSLTIE